MKAKPIYLFKAPLRERKFKDWEREGVSKYDIDISLVVCIVLGGYFESWSQKPWYITVQILQNDQLIVAKWHHATWLNLVIIGLGNGFLPVQDLNQFWLNVKWIHMKKV